MRMYCSSLSSFSSCRRFSRFFTRIYDVEGNQGRIDFARELQSFFAIGGHDHIITFRLEVSLEDIAGARMVIHKENGVPFFQ